MSAKKPSVKDPLKAARMRHDKTLHHIKLIEDKVPMAAKITRHPRYGRWVPPLLASLEVAAPLLFFLVVLPFIIRLLPSYDLNLPLPSVNLPDVNLPSLPLPDINLPNFPTLPEWLRDTLYWAGKTSPIWIAVFFAIYELKKRDRAKK